MIITRGFIGMQVILFVAAAMLIVSAAVHRLPKSEPVISLEKRAPCSEISYGKHNARFATIGTAETTMTVGSPEYPWGPGDGEGRVTDVYIRPDVHVHVIPRSARKALRVNAH